MKTKKSLLILPLALLVLSLPFCGGKPVAMGDIPVFPGAIELTAGTSPVAASLSRNEKTDAAMRQALNSGGKIEQRAWRLPDGAAWAEVRSFYEEKLTAAGWQSGVGNIGGGFVDVNKIMEAANQSNPMSQTILFTRGKQSLTLIMLALPATKDGTQLIASLASN